MRKLNGIGFFFKNSYLNINSQSIISYPTSVWALVEFNGSRLVSCQRVARPNVPSPCPDSVMSMNRATFFFFVGHCTSNHIQTIFPYLVKVSLWKLKIGSSTLLSWKIETDYFQTPHSAWVGDDFSLHGNRNQTSAGTSLLSASLPEFCHQIHRNTYNISYS